LPVETSLPGATRNAMMIKATDIRRGMVITIEGTNFVVVDFAHHTPGNLRAMVQTKLRNMNSGALIEKRLRSVDQIEVPYVETKEFEYLYSSGDEHVFMDTETYDQLPTPKTVLGDAANYLKEGDSVVLQMYGGDMVGVDLPAAVELTVTETEPGLQGDRVSGARKPATLETGLVLQVPLFVNIGDRVKVDTRSGDYLTRAAS
jgi:elongation factor P